MAKRTRKKKAVQNPGASALPFRLGREWLWGLLLVAAVVLAYAPVWWAGFVWDDEPIITLNSVVAGSAGLKEIWTTEAADICPFTITTFWLEHKLWDLNPLPYHVVNVLMHAAGAVLLWRVLRSLRVPGAWLGAALWALHPALAESVGWVSEMKNTESGVFFLLAILFFVKGLRAGGTDGKIGNGWYYGWTLLFSALAMASKSSTVILPAVLCLCAWWAEGRWQWRFLLKVAPLFLMSIAAGILSMWKQRLEGSENPHWLRNWPERLVTAGDAVWFYLGKLIWPHPLMMIYPRWQIDAGKWFAWLPLLAVIVLLFVLWMKRESWARPWFFAFAYFLVALFPVMGLVSLNYFRYSFVADHFQYLASMGVLALAGAGLARLADFALPENTGLQWSLGAGVLAILGIMTWQRAWVFETNEILWTDTLAKNSKCGVAYTELGAEFLKVDQTYEAIAYFRKAIEIDPYIASVYNDLGIALGREGKVDDAIVQYRETLKLEPDAVEAQYNLGGLLLQKGQLDEAAALFQQALKIGPNLAAGRYQLGKIYAQQWKLEDAIEQFQKGLEADPDDGQIHDSLGMALYQTGKVDQAIDEFQEALRLNPGDGLARQNLTRAQTLPRR